MVDDIDVKFEIYGWIKRDVSNKIVSDSIKLCKTIFCKELILSDYIV